MQEENKALVASSRTNYATGSYNILPSEGKSTWVVRIKDIDHKKIFKNIIQQITKITQAIVAEESKNYKSDVKVNIDSRPGYRSVILRDPELIHLAEQAAAQIIDDYNKDETFQGSGGGEDYSFYLEEFRDKTIPGVFLRVGATNSAKGATPVKHHTPKFQIDLDVVSDLTALHAVFTMKVIQHLKQKSHKKAEYE